MTGSLYICVILASSAAENLISILQAREEISAQSQNSTERKNSDTSHGSNVQESPSERELQIFRLTLCVSVCMFVHYVYNSAHHPAWDSV